MAEERFGFTLTRESDYRFTVEFDQDGVPPLLLDEPAPLGDDAGPNASRLIAAAVGNCLSASLLFCMKKARIEPSGMTTEVEGTLVRNEEGRLRIGSVGVRIHPELPEEDRPRLTRCLDLFEDFCVVTESVRNGIEVDVEVEPVTPSGIDPGELVGAGS